MDSVKVHQPFPAFAYEVWRASAVAAVEGAAAAWPTWDELAPACQQAWTIWLGKSDQAPMPVLERKAQEGDGGQEA